MLKVIQTILNQLQSLLHRGLVLLNPYDKNSNNLRKEKKGLFWTLDFSFLSSRCSRTFIRDYIRKSQNIRTIGVLSSVVLAFIMVLSIAPVALKGDSTNATTGTATESKTTVTINKANADLTINPDSADGTFATSTDSEKASFSVATTNYTGYTLTIKASDDNGTLTNTTATGTFSTIDSVIDEKTFDTSSYNGKWGYKPSRYNSVENVAFWPSPTTKATTIDVTDEANSSANTYTIALGARADYTQATGTYTKVTTLTATANPSAYSITYADNTGDTTVKNLPDITTSTTSSTTITLSTVTPSRTGYVFDGWCSVAPTNSGQTCSGTRYSVGGSYGIDQTTTNITTLYATWTIPNYSITIKTATGVSSVKLNSTTCTSPSGCTVNNLTYGKSYTLTATAEDGYIFSSWYVDGLGNVDSATSASTSFTVGEGGATIVPIARYTMPAGTTMQGFTSAMCEAMPMEQSYPLTDTRDNTIYMVAKLKDGKCWMVQNLRLGARGDNLVLTSEDSNVETSFTLSANEAGESGSFPHVSMSYGWVKDKSEYYCTNNYGCYYNWFTATAGSGKGEGDDATPVDSTVNYSICPRGWALPTGGNGGDFEILTNAYGGTSSVSAIDLLVANPNVAIENINGQYSPGMLLGGSYATDATDNISTVGRYWSRTTTTSSRGASHTMYIATSGTTPTANRNKFEGIAVRCLLAS